MPDFCYNTITGSAEDIKAVLEIMKSERSDFDFENIIPMPEILHRTVAPMTIVEDQEWDPAELEKPEIHTLSKSKYDEFVAQYGTDNWYDWAKWNWGTAKPAVDAKAEAEKITFVTAYTPPNRVFAELASRLPADTELDIRCVLDQGNGAEYQIADNMVADVDFWEAPAFEYPLDSLTFLMKCYCTGGQGNRFVDGQWYFETDQYADAVKGYRTALEALVDADLEPGDLDDELPGIVQDFWENYGPQSGTQMLDYIEANTPDLSGEVRKAIQKTRDAAPAQELVARPKA